MRESAIERYLVKRVKEAGGETRKVKWIGRRGAPDRLVMFPLLRGGVWVEVKRPRGVVEPHQKREHTRMRRKGQRVVIIASKAEVDDFVLDCTQWGYWGSTPPILIRDF